MASNLCPINSLIIGVDLAPIKPLNNVITFQSDITTEHCRSQLRGHMKTWKADTVLHDGAPNVGMAWTQDAYNQSELVLQSLKLAVEFLVPGGTFVTKVFRSKDYNNLMWVFQQFFDKVEATKPPASRNVSAEIFVVCRGFKAPKKVDPRLLDSKAVFEEVNQKNENNQQKVYNPEKHTRKREGYEEGDYLQFHAVSALEFVHSDDPINMLGRNNQFTYDYKAVPELKQLKKLPQTTDELLECFKDLKVLGKKDFRMILKWRLAARDFLGLDKKEEDEEEVEVEPLDEEEQIEKELGDLQEKERLRRKREKRKANEMKQREITRMQMNMATPFEIGIEAGSQGGSMFNLKQAERTGKLDELIKGKKAMVFDNSHDDDVLNLGDHDVTMKDDDRNSENEADNLEAELEAEYEDYKARKAERNARLRAKQNRENEADDWFGFEDKQESDSDSDGSMRSVDDDSDSELDSDAEEGITRLVSNLHAGKTEDGLSRKAAMFFDNPLFSQLNVPALPTAISNGKTNGQSNGQLNGVASIAQGARAASVKTNGKASSESMSDDSDSSDEEFEVVPKDDNDNSDVEDWDKEEEQNKPLVDIVTAQAMTMAHDLATGKKNKHDLVDEGFNKYAFRDKDGLPEWFLEDEAKHSKIIKPITKEAAEAIKEKLRAMNARPSKKVSEAKARKQYRAMKRLEKLRKKSDLINEDSSRSERDKAEDIAKLTRKLTKKQNKKPKVTVIAAKGKNRGLQGRPKGVKGKYKMVDGTMKKEQRALKRIQKKKK